MANGFKKPKKTKKYSSKEKKAYYMGLGYAMHRDTANTSNDVRFHGGEKAYDSFVDGIVKMNDLNDNVGTKFTLSRVFSKRKATKAKKGR